MFSIEKIGLDKITELQAISKQTFVETFAATNSAANMEHYFSEALSIATLQQEMEHKDAAFYFAFDDEHLIGYLKLNVAEVQTELKDEEALEIERIYIIKEYHGKKAGQFLLDAAIDIAHQHQAKYLWLGVWEHNHRAIAFYEKNGFITFGQHDFKLGDDIQTDIMMRLSLV